MTEKKDQALGVLIVDAKAAAAMCSLGVSTFWRYVKKRPDFPKPIYLGPRCARFKVDDLKRWVDSFKTLS